MALKHAMVLKALFEELDLPSEQDFADLIDSCVNTPMAHVTVSEPTTSVLITDLDCTNCSGLDIVYNTVVNGNAVSVLGYINGDTVTAKKRLYSNVFSNAANVLSYKDAVSIAFGWNSGQASSVTKGINNIIICSDEIVSLGRNLQYGGTNTEFFSNEAICHKQTGNINSLLIQASAVNGIGAGSWFKIYRRP